MRASERVPHIHLWNEPDSPAPLTARAAGVGSRLKDARAFERAAVTYVQQTQSRVFELRRLEPLKPRTCVSLVSGI